MTAKLQLKEGVGRTELSNGSYRQVFEPGEIYEIERQEELAFLLNQNLFTVVSADAEAVAAVEASGLPEDFPMRHVFEREGFKSVAEVQSKSREELTDINGIGEKTADAALRYGVSAVETIETKEENTTDEPEDSSGEQGVNYAI